MNAEVSRKNIDYLNKDVRSCIKYPLPKKYERYSLMFQCVEQIVQLAYNQDRRITMDFVSSNVKKWNFTESHLSKIISVYPQAYLLNWEPRRQLAGRQSPAIQLELVIKPNLKEDLEMFWRKPINSTKNAKEPMTPIMSPVKGISPIKSERFNRDFILRSPTKTPLPVLCPPQMEYRVKMEGWRLHCRKLIFKYYLVSRLKKAHEGFLEREKLILPVGHLFHPSFDVDNSVADLESGELPTKPKMPPTPTHTDIREFFRSVGSSSKKQSPAIVNPSTPLPDKASSSANRCIPSSGQGRSAKRKLFENNNDNSNAESVLDRVRAKVARKMEESDPTNLELCDRRRKLHKIEDSLLDVIQSELNLSRKQSIDLRCKRFHQVVRSSCGQETLGELKELLNELCTILPSLFSIQSIGNIECFRVSINYCSPHKSGSNCNSNRASKWCQLARKSIKKQLEEIEEKIENSVQLNF